MGPAGRQTRHRRRPERGREALEALGGIYEQCGGLMSDELGEPIEKKQSHEALARNCSDAIGPKSTPSSNAS